MKIENYIAGALLAPQSASYIDVFEPAVGQAYAQLPNSDERDIEAAVVAAQQAFPSWSALSAEERASYLDKLANYIEAHLQEFAEAESKDSGKPISLSLDVEIPRAISNFRFFASAIRQFSSEAHPIGDTVLNYTLRQPIGVVACISPWNLPLYLFSWKIVPALAAGNCVIAKPSEITPMTAYLLAKACIAVGLPAGVLNIVNGLGPNVGNPISHHPHIKAISFTGGTATGKIIAGIAAPMFKKLSLELGGKNPNIIFADCDLEQAIETSIRSSFQNQGQICLCGSRIFVERSIYEQFKTAFIAKAKTLRQGDPMNAATQQGAIVSELHYKKILSCIELAKEEGGTILLGGKAAQQSGRCNTGWFIEPTIIEGLPQSCRTNREEIFGPVVTIMPFDSEEEVIGYANDTEYGLAATIWTNNLNRAHRVSAKLQSGIVWVNCWLLRDLRTPFGGVKSSGVGREGGWEALKFFTEAKNVCIKLG